MQEKIPEKIVIDTNILISGCFWNGLSHKLLKKAELEELKIVLTKEIISEFLEVLNSDEIKNKIEIKNLKINPLVIKIIEMSEIIETKQKVLICEDYDDNKFLEAAIECKAKYLVSKDKHLLKLKNIEKTKIVTPEQLFFELNT